MQHRQNKMRLITIRTNHTIQSNCPRPPGKQTLVELKYIILFSDPPQKIPNDWVGYEPNKANTKSETHTNNYLVKSSSFKVPTVWPQFSSLLTRVTPPTLIQGPFCRPRPYRAPRCRVQKLTTPKCYDPYDKDPQRRTFHAIRTPRLSER